MLAQTPADRKASSANITKSNQSEWAYIRFAILIDPERKPTRDQAMSHRPEIKIIGEIIV
jgi:hypothetical protein